MNVEPFIQSVGAEVRRALEGTGWHVHKLKAARGFYGTGADIKQFMPHARGDTLVFVGIADHAKHGAKTFKFVAKPEIMGESDIKTLAEDVRKGLDWSAVGEQE